MRECKESDRPIFIQFAGQGVRYMEDLRRIYTASPLIRPFIHQAISEINRQREAFDDRKTGFFAQGLAVEQWIGDPSRTPDLGYLLSSPISHPLIYLTQISEYISILMDGLDQRKLLHHTHSLTGFSTGVVAALLVSMGLEMADLLSMAIRVQAMFFWQGIRTQMSMMAFGENPALDMALYGSKEGSPSAMASVTPLTRKRLDQAILAFKPEGEVYVAYDLFPGRFIVAGLPGTLARFSLFLKGLEGEIQWRYIPSTIGAHSPLLAPALELSPRDAEALGVRFNGSDLKRPVWGNDKGLDLRESENIMHEVIRAYFIDTGHFRKQIKPLLPPSTIRYVLDFGPGTGIASLTENHTATTGIKVIRCTLPLGRKQLMEEVMA